jgi:hypothetical protein
VGGRGVARLVQAGLLSEITVERAGADIVVGGYVSGGAGDAPAGANAQAARSEA